MRYANWLILLLLSSVLATTATAEPHWPSFRGPSGQGVAAERSLPLRWSETENVAWKTAIPGKGWSSPVIYGDEIWMTTAVEQTSTAEAKARLEHPNQQQVAKSISLRAICLNRRLGTFIKDIGVFEIDEPGPIHAVNSYASPTPVIEDGRLYCHFGTFGTACVNTETGEKLWRRRLPVQHAVGPGSSPVVWQDLLVLVCDGMQEQYVTALDKHTGKSVWKTPRPPMTGDNGDFHKAFSSPLAIRWNGKSQLLIPGAQWFVSYEPASGEMLWFLNHGKGFSNVAAPIFANGISYWITGFTKPELWAVPVSSEGELSAENVLWEQKKQVPKKSSPAIIGNEIYMIGDSGVLSCVDVHSGDLVWSARLGGNYSASPIYTEDRIYFCSHEGKTTVVKPNATKFEALAENELDGQLMASPVPGDGALLIRSDKHLYRIEQK